MDGERRVVQLRLQSPRHGARPGSCRRDHLQRRDDGGRPSHHVVPGIRRRPQRLPRPGPRGRHLLRHHLPRAPDQCHRMGGRGARGRQRSHHRGQFRKGRSRRQRDQPDVPGPGSRRENLLRRAGRGGKGARRGHRRHHHHRNAQRVQRRGVRGARHRPGAGFRHHFPPLHHVVPQRGHLHHGHEGLALHPRWQRQSRPHQRGRDPGVLHRPEQRHRGSGPPPVGVPALRCLGQPLHHGGRQYRRQRIQPPQHEQHRAGRAQRGPQHQ